jgi:hypothetical protein
MYAWREHQLRLSGRVDACLWLWQAFAGIRDTAVLVMASQGVYCCWCSSDVLRLQQLV